MKIEKLLILNEEKKIRKLVKILIVLEGPLITTSRAKLLHINVTTLIGQPGGLRGAK
jgi:hypothetical protein